MYMPVNRAEFVNATQIAAGDTRNIVRVKLMTAAGVPIDVTGKTVTWSAKHDGKVIVSGRAATVYAGGEVGIKFLTADAVKQGTLYLQFKVVWTASEHEYFPADGNLYLLLT